LRFGKNGTLVSLSATGKAKKGRKLFEVLLMHSSVVEVPTAAAMFQQQQQ
jgi:hypothetical protein